MKRLLNIELLTLKDSRKAGLIFFILFLFFTCIGSLYTPDILEAYYGLVNEGASQETLDETSQMIASLRTSNDIVGYTFYIAGALKYLLLLFFVSYVLKSYRLNTLKQSVADGMKKMDFIKGKVMAYGLIFTILAVCTLIIALIMGPMIDPSFYTNLSIASVLGVMIGYLIEQITFFSVIMIVSMYLKKSNLVLALIAIYCFCGVYFLSFIAGDYMMLLPLNTNFVVNAFPVKKYLLEISQFDSIFYLGLGISTFYILLSSILGGRILKKQNLSLKVN